jgi:hypothetical protein
MINLNDTNFYYNDLTMKILNQVQTNIISGNRKFEKYTHWDYPIAILNNWQTFKYEYDIIRESKDQWYDFDIVGSSGPDESHEPSIQLSFLVKKGMWIRNAMKHFGNAKIANVIAHELHHLAQNIECIPIADIESIPRHMRENPYVNYFLNPYEREAYHIGFRAESDISGRSLRYCIHDYLYSYKEAGKLTQSEYDYIYIHWCSPEIELVKQFEVNIES